MIVNTERPTMKKLYFIGVLAVSLLTTVCYAQQNTTFDDHPKITVNGEAIVKVRPDRIMINFGIETSDKVIDTARQKNADISRKAMAIFEKNGVPRKDIQTDFLAIEPRYRNQHLQEEFMGYFVRNTLVVTLNDPAKVEDLISQSLEAGINYLHGVDFQTTELRKHRDAARDLALKAAREKADRMAATLGQTVGAPLQISEGYGGSPWGYYSSWNGWGGNRSSGMSQNTMQIVGNGNTGETGETIALGMISIRANVNVTFQLGGGPTLTH